MSTEAACKGKPNVADHALVELGRCSHYVGDGTYTYLEYGCPDCGATSRRGPVVFASHTRQKAEPPTAENCLALKWKAERKAAEAQP